MPNHGKFQVGDLVAPQGRTQLRSGAGAYIEAVVIQSNPLILTSVDASMKWSATVDDMDLIKIGVVSDEVIADCMRRL